MSRPRRDLSARGLAEAGLLLALSCALAASVDAGLPGGNLVRGTAAGLGLFLTWRLVVVRLLVTGAHRRGMALGRAGRTEEALRAFEASYRRWDRRRWLDDARGILLASTGRWPFRLLDRANAAACLARLGRHDEALALLDRVLAERPDMRPARELRAALRAAEARPGESPLGDPTWGGMWEAPPSAG